QDRELPVVQHALTSWHSVVLSANSMRLGKAPLVKPLAGRCPKAAGTGRPAPRVLYLTGTGRDDPGMAHHPAGARRPRLGSIPPSSARAAPGTGSAAPSSPSASSPDWPD